MVKTKAKEDSKHVSKYLVEFKDKGLEKDFFNHEITIALKYIKPILLVLGGLYLLFIVPDYFLTKDYKIFKAILMNRIIILILIFILYIRLKYQNDFTMLAYWFTAYEIIVSLSFLLIFYQYESPDFLIQSLGVIIIILSIFLVPNKWKNMILASLTVSVGFFVLSLLYLKDIKFSEFSAGVVYIVLVIILSSISSYRMNYYKRIQYINSKKLIKMSMTDALTGIHNRTKFNEELARWVEFSKRYKTALSLVIFDIDDFKKINDSFGHLIGDEVIVETVNIVKNVMRKTDVFARWGGEEFVILLPNTKIQQAVNLAERLRTSISEYRFGKAGHISCSFGVAPLKESDDIETFLLRADERLYLAKDAGKNIVME